MLKVIKLGIANSKSQTIEEVSQVEALSGKGLVGDRHFRENNNIRSQITLIESENVDYYNYKFKTNYKYTEFRRNVVTKGIELNGLVGKELLIGKVKVKGHDLCRPCKHLEETLKGRDIIKEFLWKGGLRCEILVSGQINLYDDIKII